MTDGYNTGLTQGAGTGPVTPVAMPTQDTQGAAGVDQLIKTMFPITSPMGGPQTIDMKPPITSPMQGGGPTMLGDPSPGKLNFGTAPAQPKPLRPVRPFGGGSGGQNPFFK
jgi:hypothetical protein